MNETDALIEEKEPDKQSPKLRLWKAEIATSRMCFAESQFKDAERLLTKAMHLSEALEERSLAEGVCHLELGMIRACTDRKPEAIKEFDRAVEQANKSNHERRNLLSGLALIHQARVYFDMNNKKHAVENLKKAMKLLETFGGEAANHMATAMCDLGAIHLVDGEYAEARPLLKSARELTTLITGADSPAYLRAVMLDDIAQTGDDDYKYELWITAATRAQYQTGTKHPLLKTALNRLSKIARKSGRPDVVETMQEIFPEFDPKNN